MPPVSNVCGHLQDLKLCELFGTQLLFLSLLQHLFTVVSHQSHQVTPYPFCLMSYMQFACKWIKLQGPETEFASLVFINANSCVHLAKLPPSFPCQIFPSETPYQL